MKTTNAAAAAPSYPRTVTAIFYECEHSGDMERYTAELRRAGARIESANLIFEEECYGDDEDDEPEVESCRIKITVRNADTAKRVSATDAWSGFGPGTSL